MKAWIFTQNEKIIGPLTGEETVKFVQKNPSAYAWHPSYTHWMPVNRIEEFADLVALPAPPPAVPLEMMDAFYSKEKALLEKFDIINARITVAEQSMIEFGQEITHYKKLTKDCNIEMQDTLRSIEEQYAKLKKNLRSFSENSVSDKSEFKNVVNEFENTVTVKKTLLNNEKKSIDINTVKPTVIRLESDAPDTKLNVAEDVEVVSNVKPADEKEVGAVIGDTEQAEIEHAVDATGRTKPTKAKQIGDVKTEHVVEKTSCFESLEAVGSVVNGESIVSESALSSGDAISPSQRIIRQPEPAVSQTASRATASLSSQVSVVPDLKPTLLKGVEYSEDISPEDRYVSSKMQQFQSNADNMTALLKKHENSEDYGGDFDYILKEKYGLDNNSDSLNSEEKISGDEATEGDDNTKKRRRRRRR